MFAIVIWFTKTLLGGSPVGMESLEISVAGGPGHLLLGGTGLHESRDLLVVGVGTGGTMESPPGYTEWGSVNFLQRVVCSYWREGKSTLGRQK